VAAALGAREHRVISVDMGQIGGSALTMMAHRGAGGALEGIPSPRPRA
jgi:hypothetical protein